MNYETSAPFIRVLGRALQARTCVVLNMSGCHSGGAEVQSTFLPSQPCSLWNAPPIGSTHTEDLTVDLTLRLENEMVMDKRHTPLL